MNINLGGNTLTNGYFAGIITGTGGGSGWVIKVADYSAVAGDSILADTTYEAFTITLPASPNPNDQINIADPQGTWATNNLTIDGNGNNIYGADGNLICDVSGASISLVFVGGTEGWAVYV
jgi:hypothetical protein